MLPWSKEKKEKIKKPLHFFKKRLINSALYDMNFDIKK